VLERICPIDLDPMFLHWVAFQEQLWSILVQSSSEMAMTHTFY